MSLSDPALWAALIIGAVVVISIVRLILWHRSVPTEAQGSRTRLAVLIGGQVVVGTLLWLTLHPPTSVLRVGTLIVATGNAPASVQVDRGDILIALPEAGSVADAERAPDLATALRRHPTPARIRIVGDGLVPRDQRTLPVPVEFAAPALPHGLTDFAPPDPLAAGATFVVGGQVGTSGGLVELLDPADQVVDRAVLKAGERFALTASARAPGLALFDLRLRDPAGEMVERIAVPIQTLEQNPPRVAIVAGAPGPETKFLQRWAEDAGVDLTMDLEVGAGVTVGGAPLALNANSLGQLDLLVIDDRRWSGLSATQKAAITVAVDRGMGLLFRPSGPLSPGVRRDWTGLGLALGGGDNAVALSLETPRISKPDADATVEASDETPGLARRDLAIESASAVTLLRDSDGAALASWRARGRGRVGVWTVTDSYALVLTGRADRYGEMWSALFSELGRAGQDSRARVEGLARAGDRVVLCRLMGDASVLGQDGRNHGLRVDPATGERACAAFWPEQPGWHVIGDGEGRQTPFYVHPAEEASSLTFAANRAATLALVGSEVGPSVPGSTSRAPGSPWPWFFALLVAASALWWLERNRTVGGLAKSLRARLGLR